MFQLKECIFWTKVTYQISTFWTFHCLSKVGQVSHGIFETRSQFLQKLCTILYITSQLKCKWNFLENLIQSVNRSLNLLFQHTLFPMFPIFKKYLNSQVRTNKLVNSFLYHPCPSILALGIHPYFFKLLRVLSLCRILVEFSVTCIFPQLWEKVFN